MVKKYISEKSELSRSAREIVNSHPWGYWGAVVEGPRGRGKTAFCLHTQRQVYQFYLGITRDDAWKVCLENVMFSLEDIDKMLDILDTINWDNVLEWQKENTMLCKIWDDAGMHGGKYKYFVAAKLVEHLQGNLDIIRFILTGFMINAPELANLLKFLREYRDQKIIKIAYREEGAKLYDRVARVKRWREDRMHRYRLMNFHSTKFSCFVDAWVYEEFTKMKAKAIMANRSEFKQMMKKAEIMEPDLDPRDAIGVPREYIEIEE